MLPRSLYLLLGLAVSGCGGNTSLPPFPLSSSSFAITDVHGLSVDEIQSAMPEDALLTMRFGVRPEYKPLEDSVTVVLESTPGFPITAEAKRAVLVPGTALYELVYVVPRDSQIGMGITFRAVLRGPGVSLAYPVVGKFLISK